MKNYYEILEIDIYASQEVIKAAYKALVKKYHPDNCEDKNCEERMVEINEAYQILSNPVQKLKYDENLKKEFKEAQERDNIKNETESVGDEETITNEKGFFARFFENAKESIISEIKKAQKQYEKCYLEGLNMGDARLVLRYKKATGSEKAGYARALEERGFLEKDRDGRYRPTYIMRQYL